MRREGSVLACESRNEQYKVVTTGVKSALTKSDEILESVLAFRPELAPVAPPREQDRTQCTASG